MPFSVRHLTESDASNALALVHVVRPLMTEDDWVAFVTRMRGRGAGVVGITDERGYLYGLFSYRVTESLKYGWSLNVDDIVIAGLPGVKSIRQALTESIEDLSERFRCEHTVVSAAIDVSQKNVLIAPLTSFRDEGYVATGMWVSKPVSRVAKNRHQ